MTLDEARENVGRAVAYHPHGWCGCDAEEGEITSVGGGNVFVRYGYDQYSKATRPGDLTLLAEGAGDG